MGNDERIVLMTRTDFGKLLDMMFKEWSLDESGRFKALNIVGVRVTDDESRSFEVARADEVE